MERNPSLDSSDLFILKYKTDISTKKQISVSRDWINHTAITINFHCDLNAFMGVILLMCHKVFFKKINKLIKSPHQKKKKKDMQTLFKNVQVKIIHYLDGSVLFKPLCIILAQNWQK